MLRLIVAVVAAAWAVAGWKNLPRLDHPSNIAAGLAIAGTCGVCYWCGRALTRNSAYASARASAIATARAAADAKSNAQAAAAINVFMAGPEGGTAGSVPLAVQGLDDAPWIGPPKAVAEQDVVVQMLEDGGQLEGEYVDAD